MGGESDAGRARDADAYHANLIELVHSLRKDLSAPSLPFIASQLAWPHAKKKPLTTIHEAIERACAPDGPLARAACCYLDPARPVTTWEDGHLDSESLMERGSS